MTVTLASALRRQGDARGDRRRGLGPARHRPSSAPATAVTIPVKADWGAGAYVVALAHRPLDAAAKRMPGRALGARLVRRSTARRAPCRCRSARRRRCGRGRRCRCRSRSPASRRARRPSSRVAAVDVGILNLTRYEPPDPVAYFFGQRQLAAEIRDLYGYPDRRHAGRRAAPSAPAATPPAALEGSPPTQEPLARYSGVVKVGPDGTAKVDFDIPAFNGTVRVMAVAWSAGKRRPAPRRRDRARSGRGRRHAAALPRPRRPVALLSRTSTMSRAPAGDYTVDARRARAGRSGRPVRRAAPIEARRQGAQVTVSIPVTAAAGRRHHRPAPDRPGRRRDAELRAARCSRARRRVVPPHACGRWRPAQTLDGHRPICCADFLPGTGAVSVAASPLPASTCRRCCRRSTATPMAAPSRSSAAPCRCSTSTGSPRPRRWRSTTKADDRIRDAIERVLSRQDSSGAFGLWSVGGDDLWLDAFVTDFLTRARERGFAVPQERVRPRARPAAQLRRQHRPR